MLNPLTDTFIAVDYAPWDGGVVGGIFRTTKGNILIRVDNFFQADPLATELIAIDLIAKLKRYIAAVPAALCWPVSILLDELPDYDEQTQAEGFEKLMLHHSSPLEKSTAFRFIG